MLIESTTSHHAGIAPNEQITKLNAVPVSAYTAALKEYEEDSNTESESDGDGDSDM